MKKKVVYAVMRVIQEVYVVAGGSTTAMPINGIFGYIPLFETAEESWSFVKEFKNPVIDFKRLQQLTFTKVKTLKPKIF